MLRHALQVSRRPPPLGAAYGPRALSTARLRVPSTATRGTPADVPAVLPILAELSVGALRGTPAWVPSPALSSPEITRRKRSASYLEITYPFSTDEELRSLYMMADRDSLRVGMFLEELDAFSADCSMVSMKKCAHGGGGQKTNHAHVHTAAAR